MQIFKINFSKNSLNKTIPLSPSKDKPLKIGLIGKDWARKGGPIVLDIVNKLNALSIPTVLRVVGLSKKQLPKNEHIQVVGFINKYENMENFISEIQSWHFGTLFSKAEAFGISNRECLLLGVPIICHDVGGIISTLPENDLSFGRIFRNNEKTQNIANWVSEVIKDYSQYIEIRNQISKSSVQFSWESTIKKMFKYLHDIEKK